MLSVILATLDSERPLVRTLSALVPAAATGLVREVLISDGGSTDATLEVADIAGCTVTDTKGTLDVRLRAAAANARADWLMFLRPGTVLEPAWDEEVRRFVEQADMMGDKQRAASFRRTANLGMQTSQFAEALSLLRSSLSRRVDPTQGLLISRRHYERIDGHRSPALKTEEYLLRNIGRRNIVVLRSGAMHSPA
jgi:glycosyltransferase involved in cell wall biosynthesis